MSCKLCLDSGVTFTLEKKNNAKFVWSCSCSSGAPYRFKYKEYRNYIEGHMHWNFQYQSPHERIENISLVKDSSLDDIPF